jgi:hypothetical protein
MLSVPRFVPSWVFALFMRISEPRVERLFQFAVYLAAIVVGLMAWFNPPSAIAWSIGAPMTFTWGALLTVGGVLGASSVLRGSFWLERAGLLFCATGLGIYGLAGLFIEVSGTGPARGVSLAITTMAIISLAARWPKIRRYAYDPER